MSRSGRHEGYVEGFDEPSTLHGNSTRISACRGWAREMGECFSTL